MDLQAELRAIFDNVNYGVSAVIVEGIHDESALREAGVKSYMIQFCSSGVPNFAFVDEMVYNYKGMTVLILLDFDKEGTRMADRMSQELEERGVRVERTLRRKIGCILAGEGMLRIEEMHKIRDRAQ